MAGFEVEKGELGEKPAVFSNGEKRREKRLEKRLKRPFLPSPQGNIWKRRIRASAVV